MGFRVYIGFKVSYFGSVGIIRWDVGSQHAPWRFRGLRFVIEWLRVHGFLVGGLRVRMFWRSWLGF